MSRPEPQRALPRIAYPAEVRLVPPGRKPVLARSHNLSARGVFVETDSACEVGTAVLCVLPVPGGERQLKGLVRRTQPLSVSRFGLGIQFVDLAPQDQRLLESLVEQGAGEEARGHLVKVKFEGLSAPLRSRATVTDEGIRLSTALPFLRLESKVDVSFIAGESRIESQGVLRNVAIAPASPDGVPRLAVDLDLPQSEAEGVAASPPPSPAQQPPSSGARSTSRTAGRAAQRRSESRGRGRAGEPSAASSSSEGAPPSPPRRGRWLHTAGRLVAPGAFGFLATVVALHHRTLGSIERRLAQGILLPPATSGTGPAVAQAPAPTTLAHALIAEPHPAAPSRAAAPSAPPGAPQALRSINLARRSRPMPPPLPPDATGPALTATGGTSTMAVPVRGSLEGVEQYTIADPPSVAVNLPRAESVLPLGQYWTRRDGFRLLWIRELPPGGVQLRFVFTYPTPREPQLDLDVGTVKLHIKLPTP